MEPLQWMNSSDWKDRMVEYWMLNYWWILAAVSLLMALFEWWYFYRGRR